MAATTTAHVSNGFIAVMLQAGPLCGAGGRVCMFDAVCTVLKVVSGPVMFVLVCGGLNAICFQCLSLYFYFFYFYI